MKLNVCVVGLGYVGLPLALALAKKFPTIGLDVNKQRIATLKKNKDSTGEVASKELKKSKITFTTDPQVIAKNNFIIVTVPTPITGNNKPDLGLVRAASKTVGKYLQKGSIVVYESTVYPGVTEEICLPILEKESGLKAGSDFKVGYSPERINPGDTQHTVDKIIKVVSGMDRSSLNTIAQVYEKVTKAGVHKASSIKVAEAAKVIENIQRDLNIALMNELSLIFEKMDIPTRDVIEAAGTKWNFAKYYPGMVGGHCIGVDPYYLTHKAQELGHHPRVILAGRGINNSMPKHIARYILDHLTKNKNKTKGKSKSANKKSRVAVLGLSFKENVSDIRNSKAKDIIDVLKKNGVEVVGHDPLVKDDQIKEEFKISSASFAELSNIDCFVFFSPHDQFKSISLTALKRKANKDPLLIDIKSFFSRKEAQKAGFSYKTL